MDRLIRVCRPNEYTQYTYDAMNRRLSKRTIRNGHTIQKERYLYHGQNEIGCYEKDSPTYTLKELRILGVGLGAEIGASVAMELSGKIYIPFHDHNGNITTLVRANGWIFESYRYSAFGEIETYDQGKSPTTSTLNPWKFSGKRQDLETGFVYFGRRYYFPKLGRWITQDPSGYDEGPNLYAYVFNSPLFHYDLYGLFAFDTDVIADFNRDWGNITFGLYSPEVSKQLWGPLPRNPVDFTLARYQQIGTLDPPLRGFGGSFGICNNLEDTLSILDML